MTLLKQNASWLGQLMDSIEYIDFQEAITGRLDDNGNNIGDPTTGATPGKLWVRLNGGRGGTQVIIGALMWQYAAINDLRVLTGINRSGVRVAIKRAEDEEAVYTIGNQLNSPEARNDPLPTRLLTGGRVLPRGDTPTPGLTVFVEAYPQGGLAFNDPAFDISADEPGNAGEFGWSVIYITDAGVLASAPSTPRLVPTADGLLIQDALDVVIPEGAIRLQAVSLYNGQTDVLASNSRFLELRDYLSPRVSTSGSTITAGDYADTRPASPSDGDMFIPTDGYWWEVYHDSIWNPYKNNLLLTTPPASGWSWDNQGSATIDSSLGALHLYVPAGTSSLSTRARYRTAPSVPYTITVHLDLNILTATNPYAMVGWRQSSDGKLACLMFSMGTTTTQPKLFSAKFTNSTTHSANYTSGDIAWIPEWIQIIDDNTNRIIKYSKDGKNFLTLHSVGRTDFLTADQVFFGVAPISTANDASMTIYSWAVT